MRALHWFRADLRLRDNTALAAAAREASEIACVFVFDPRLCDPDDGCERRLAFLEASVAKLAESLAPSVQMGKIRSMSPAISCD